MKQFKKLTVAVFVAGMALLGNPSYAQDLDIDTPQDVDSLQKGESFEQGGTVYQVYPELRAKFNKKKINDNSLPEDEDSQSAFLNKPTTFKKGKANASRQFGDVFLETKNFVIYKETKQVPKNFMFSPRASGFKTDDQSALDYPVVYNSKTKQFGVLKGHILVQTKEGASFSSPQFEVVKEFQPYGYYMVDIPKTLSIQNSLNKLKNNGNVEKATVEIQEYFYEPM